MKRKAPLRTRTRLARTGHLRRKTPLRPVNPQRRERLRDRQYGDAAAKVRQMPCLVPGCWGQPIQAAHVRSRGAGGTADDLVPLCWHHHAEQHRVGVETFAQRHRLDLRAEAERGARQLAATRS